MGFPNNHELSAPSFIITWRLDELEEGCVLELGRELSSLFDADVLISIDLIVIEEDLACAMKKKTHA